MVVLAVMAVLALCLALLIVAVYALARKDGRAARLKAGMKTLGIGVGIVLLLGGAGSYYQNARTRAAVVRFQTERSDVDAGRYTAQYAYLGGDRILLRLYRTSDMTLLAERTYEYPDAVRLIWTKESLIYDTAVDRGGEIKLPPSFSDRLAALLP